MTNMASESAWRSVQKTSHTAITGIVWQRVRIQHRTLKTAVTKYAALQASDANTS